MLFIDVLIIIDNKIDPHAFTLIAGIFKRKSFLKPFFLIPRFPLCMQSVIIYMSLSALY